MTDTNLKNSAQSSGNDILFTASDGQTKLNHEIELYNSSAGQLIAWVKVPALSSTTDTVIYIYYGNSSASNQQNRTGTWNSNFTSVYHMYNASDSTSNGYNLSTQGTAPTATGSGYIDGAQAFGGAGNFDNTSQQFSVTSSFTFNVWAYSNNWTQNGSLIQQGIDTGNGWNASMGITGGCSRPVVSTVFGTSVADATCNPFTSGTWHMITGTYDGSSGLTTLYTDGVYNNSGTGVNSGRGAPAGMYIGYGQDELGYFTGTMDEVEISNVALSAAWISTEYNNQNSPSTFSSAGSQQTNGGSSSLSILTSLTLPNGTAGSQYSVQLQASGGTSSYTWSLAPASTLPQGLSLASGIIAGTPSATGTYNFDITVTDTASHTASALFNLTVVAASGGGGGSGGSSGALITSYQYDLYDNLVQVTMPRTVGGQVVTQTRTFTYSGKFLLTATNPENGMVTYTYDGNQNLITKQDAKGQKIAYTYDTNQRIMMTQRYPFPGTTEDTCQRTTYYYDGALPSGVSWSSQYSSGRLSAMQWGQVGAIGAYYSSCAVPYQFTELYSYTPGGLVTTKQLNATGYIDYNGAYSLQTLSMPTSQTYDNMGRVQTITYPNAANLLAPTFSITSPITTLTTLYDGSGRPNQLTDYTKTNPYDYADQVQYGPSGELTKINYVGGEEIRTYNSLVQLTAISQGSNNFQYSNPYLTYAYSPTNNNGKTTQQTTYSGGQTAEQVTYAYDSLNRLIAATASNSWGLSFSYDGFGNRTAETPTQGSAPSSSLSFDGSNHVTNFGYDANGNMTSAPNVGALSYDVENRVVSASPSGGGTELYAYSPGGKRIWKLKPDGSTQEFYLYSIGGQKLSTLTMTGNYLLSALDNNVYFGSRLITSRGNAVTVDRVGSTGAKYYPYGEEETPTAQDRDKFATYYRDGTTGLDYAQNRYYASALGRFVSPDPYKATTGAANPQEWNKYAYVIGDPINYYDPDGLFQLQPGPYNSGNPLANGGGGGGGDTKNKPRPHQNDDGDNPIPGKRLPAHSLPGNKGNPIANALLAALEDLKNRKCAGIFNTNPNSSHLFDPGLVLQAMVSGISVNNTFFGSITTGRINLGFEAVTLPGPDAVSTGNSSLASTATIVLQSNPLGTSYDSLTANQLAIVLLHELGHVFNMVNTLGGSSIIPDANPDGSANDAAEAYNANLLRNCYHGGPN